MAEIFSPDSKLVEVLGKIADLMILNILFILTSIPLLTIGASTTALYAVLLKMAKGEEGYPVREYFKVFKQNFVQATLLWVILFLIGGVLSLEVLLLIQVDFNLKSLLLMLQGILILPYLSVLTFTFPLLASSPNKSIGILKSALFIPVVKLPEAMAAVALLLFFFIITIAIGPIYPKILVFWGIIGFSSVAYLIAIITNKILKVRIRK